MQAQSGDSCHPGWRATGQAMSGRIITLQPQHQMIQGRSPAAG